MGAYSKGKTSNSLRVYWINEPCAFRGMAVFQAITTAVWSFLSGSALSEVDTYEE